MLSKFDLSEPFKYERMGYLPPFCLSLFDLFLTINFPELSRRKMYCLKTPAYSQTTTKILGTLAKKVMHIDLSYLCTTHPIFFLSLIYALNSIDSEKTTQAVFQNRFRFLYCLQRDQE